jgi:hypothetical protein
MHRADSDSVLERAINSVLLCRERFPQFKQKTVDKRQIRLSTRPVKAGAFTDLTSLQHHSGMVINVNIRDLRIIDERLKHTPADKIRAEMDNEVRALHIA